MKNRVTDKVNIYTKINIDIKIITKKKKTKGVYYLTPIGPFGNISLAILSAA